MTDQQKTSRNIEGSAFNEFVGSLRGQVIRPSDSGYDEARKVYNGMIDRRPALITKCANVADVMSAIRFARQNSLTVAIRGGGHSVPGFGTCDDGLVIDLSFMRGIRVDPQSKSVRAESGCTWGDLNHATHGFGLATTGGIVSTTGVAGLTLGGGIGYLMRQCGLSCDNLVSADVVTADGDFLSCSESQEKDLFWAIRGGGGNFGVVTSFEFRLHPVKDILGGPIFFPLESQVLRSYSEWIGKQPEEMGALFASTLAPPLPFLPEEWHGKPVCAVISCWTGPIEQGEELLEPVRNWAEVVGAYVAPMPYPTINTLFDGLLPRGLQHYWKGNFARELPDEAIKVHIDHGLDTPSIESGMFIYPLDGATQRVASDKTAYAYRDVNFCIIIAGALRDAAGNEKMIEWARAYYDALRPYSEAGGYVNVMSGDDQDRVRANYRQNYNRLVEVKNRYDPKNLFSLNQNIKPGAS